MAKNRYSVLVEAEDWIDVEADTEAEAEELAKQQASSRLNHDWKATVMNEEEIDG